MSTPTVDPWIDAEFGGVDFQTYHEDTIMEEPDSTPTIQQDPFDNSHPEVVSNLPEPVAPVVVEPVEPEGPEIIDLGDGSSVKIEHTSKGWVASLRTSNGGSEDFKGKTKNELIQNIAIGKLHATKKIRDLNKQVKLGVSKDFTPAPQAVPAAPQQLTADDVFAIKTQLESNPDLALETWFQKKTGMSVKQLVELAQKGQRASIELDTEATNKTFVSSHPDYYADPSYENFTSLVAYIAKHKLGRTLTDRNKDELYESLVSSGLWTVQNLDEAYEELTEAGLLVTPPVRQETKETPVVQQVPVTPAPAPVAADPRIVSRVVQPRAGLGIRTSEATSVRTETAQPPSVDDLDNLTDAQIADLYQKSLRLRRMQGRR